MVYAYDQWAQMPVKDLYDTQIMAMAINAAKDMYDKGEQAIKDFRKEYGDFQTQLPEDMKWYQQNFDSAPFIQNLYDRGIDPLRSVEGRAAIQRWLNSRPYATLNKAKSNAEAYDTYLKNKADLESKGLYDPDLEAFVFNVNPNEFSSAGGDTWTRLSPIQAKTLQEVTDGIYKGRTLYNLSKDEVEAFGDKYDPRATYLGYSEAAALRDAGIGVPGLQGSPWLDYYKDQARQKVIASGQEPTEQAVQNQFIKDVAEANRRYLARPVANYDNYVSMRKLAQGDEANRIARMKAEDGDGSKNNKTSMALGLALRGASMYGALSQDPVKWQKDAQDFGRWAASQNNILHTTAQFFDDRYLMKNASSQQLFLSRFRDGQISDGGVWVDESILPRLYTDVSVKTNTLGYPESVVKNNTSGLKEFINAKDRAGNPLGVRMYTTTDIYSSPTKDHNFEQYEDVILKRDDGETRTFKFKIYESDKTKTVNQNGYDIAPNGYSITPSFTSAPWLVIEDQNMNTAAGLGSETIRRGQGEFIDPIQ